MKQTTKPAAKRGRKPAAPAAPAAAPVKRKYTRRAPAPAAAAQIAADPASPVVGTIETFRAIPPADGGEISRAVESALRTERENAQRRPRHTPQEIADLASAAMVIETVAHLKNLEREYLPLASRIRRMIERDQQLTA